MTMTILNSGARRLILAATLTLGVLTSALALPATEMRIEDLLPMGADLKLALKLNPNQTILWQQVEQKTRVIVRERNSRREKLQLALRQGLSQGKVELRDLVGGLADDQSAAAAEQTQLRELWLSVNDALDENQRQLVVNFLTEQLLRVPDNGSPHAGAPRAKDDGGGHQRGHGKAGGGMAMPGG